MLKFMIVAALSAATVTAEAAESYLCVADSSVGFKMDAATHKWSRTFFNDEDEKYIVSNKDGGWKLTELGSSWDDDCKATKYGIYCDFLYNFIMNFETLHYQLYFVGGYVGSTAQSKSPDTPYLEIGRCSKVE